jgi:hypothetical protein
VQHKNETFSGGSTITCRLEMAGQNVRFADSVIREEAVGCLGIRPILADERNALSNGASNLREQLAESVAEPRVPSRFRRSADQPEWSKLWVIESRSSASRDVPLRCGRFGVEPDEAAMGAVMAQALRPGVIKR